MASLEQQWVDADLPVLQHTRDRLLQLAGNPDNVNVPVLARLVASDPLMSLNVLRMASARRRGHLQGAPKTALEAIILIGISPLFRACEKLPVIQDVLAEHPQAIAGLTHAMLLAYNAARLAHRFAAMLDDPEAEVIHEVALLHGFAEMLLWLHRPRLALATWRPRSQEDLDANRHPAHHELPVDLAQLGLRLMKAWHLNTQLILMIQAQGSSMGHARLVDLAVRLADRPPGQAEGFSQADVLYAASVLQLSVDATAEFLRKI
ncbi:MAG TPA: HDOD domain-containing protein [Rubrivivax sp.]|nr:HDOD domain-containing protein [Rubrivivax sp.]